MIKNFENFKKIESYANGTTQWEKTYDDWEKAYLVIDDSKITRSKVRKAFELQENDTYEDQENGQGPRFEECTGDQ